jgi:hypothetical protein
MITTMSDAEKIRGLVKKYGLEYETGTFDGVTVVPETCWRLRWESNPKEEVVVHSIKEADDVLLRWKEQLKERKEKEVSPQLQKELDDRLRALKARRTT